MAIPLTSGALTGQNNIGSNQRARAFATVPNNTLLGAATQVINPGASFTTDLIPVPGFNAFMLLATVTGTLAVALQHMDPDTGVLIASVSVGNIVTGSVQIVPFGAFSTVAPSHVFGVFTLKFTNGGGVAVTLSATRLFCGAR